ncbi:MAG: hypothetical protein Q8K22_12845 [Rhodoferax sp.]|jgi:hypothetical protein|nr:hypothetical protein [Rhodoferax sp.]
MDRPTPMSGKKVLCSTLLLLSTVTYSQTSPVQGKTIAPIELRYASVLSAYQVYADEPIQPWREANDRVGRIGGWRAYAKEIRTGEQAKETPPAVDNLANKNNKKMEKQ